MTGNVKDGFVAQFVPDEVGPYIIGVEYNNVPVGGTPFTGMSHDSNDKLVVHFNLNSCLQARLSTLAT